MDALSSAASAVSQVEGVIKGTTGVQLITKTLDRMNTSQPLSGPKIDAGYQFQKNVLNAAGIGNSPDLKV